MNTQFKKQIIALLEAHRIMTIATNRPDGWPQATVVGYANEGLVLYSFIGRSSQKYANIQRDPRVSITISKDYAQPLLIKGLSLAARVLVVEDSGEMEHAGDLLMRRFQNTGSCRLPIRLKWSCFASHRKSSPFWTIPRGLDMPILSACRDRISRM